VRDLLEVKDITQIQTRGMSPTQIEEMRQFLAKMGVSDTVVTHPTTTLEDLFMRIVRERTVNGPATPAGATPGNGQSGNGKPGTV
jgi:ABC-2 type transport system ATP-binding protein